MTLLKDQRSLLMRNASVCPAGQQVSRAEAVIQGRHCADHGRLQGPFLEQLIEIPLDGS